MPKKSPAEMRAEYAAKKAPRRLGPPTPKPAEDKADTPRRLGPPMPKPTDNVMPGGKLKFVNDNKVSEYRERRAKLAAKTAEITTAMMAKRAALEAKRKSRSPRYGKNGTV